MFYKCLIAPDGKYINLARPSAFGRMDEVDMRAALKTLGLYTKWRRFVKMEPNRKAEHINKLYERFMYLLDDTPESWALMCGYLYLDATALDNHAQHRDGKLTRAQVRRLLDNWDMLEWAQKIALAKILAYNSEQRLRPLVKKLFDEEIPVKLSMALQAVFDCSSIPPCVGPQVLAQGHDGKMYPFSCPEQQPPGAGIRALIPDAGQAMAGAIQSITLPASVLECAAVAACDTRRPGVLGRLIKQAQQHEAAMAATQAVSKDGGGL